MVRHWIELAGIRPGDTVLDIGSGPGVFTLQYAKTVGNKGRVLAWEKSKEGAAYLRAELKKENIDNVEVEVVDAAKSIRSVQATIRIVMLTDVLHHADNPALIIRNLQRLPLASGAVILISEFDPSAAGSIGPPAYGRIAISEIKKWVEPLGFRIVREGSLAFEHYYLLIQIDGNNGI